MPAFVRSEITAQLVRYLVPTPKGSVIGYSELSGVVGEEVRPNSHHLKSARSILLRDHNQAWIAVRPGLGVKRLTDVEIAERLPRWFLRGARRKLVRGREQAGVVELSQLEANQQTRLAAHNIQSELALQALSRATAARLIKVAKGNSNDLPAYNILEWAITLMPAKKPPT